MQCGLLGTSGAETAPCTQQNAAALLRVFLELMRGSRRGLWESWATWSSTQSTTKPCDSLCAKWGQTRRFGAGGETDDSNLSFKGQRFWKINQRFFCITVFLTSNWTSQRWGKSILDLFLNFHTVLETSPSWFYKGKWYLINVSMFQPLAFMLLSVLFG